MSRVIVCEIGEDVPHQPYPWAMWVRASEHARFVPGSRFDYGFMGIALEEGYTVVVLPVPPSLVRQ